MQTYFLPRNSKTISHPLKPFCTTALTIMPNKHLDSHGEQHPSVRDGLLRVARCNECPVVSPGDVLVSDPGLSDCCHSALIRWQLAVIPDNLRIALRQGMKGK